MKVKGKGAFLLNKSVFFTEFHGEVYVICPRCQQDDVVKAMIKATRSIIFICPECEATWFSIGEIKFPGFVDYMTYMSSIGLSHLWDELEIISEKI